MRKMIVVAFLAALSLLPSHLFAKDKDILGASIGFNCGTGHAKNFGHYFEKSSPSLKESDMVIDVSTDIRTTAVFEGDFLMQYYKPWVVMGAGFSHRPYQRSSLGLSGQSTFVSFVAGLKTSSKRTFGIHSYIDLGLGNTTLRSSFPKVQPDPAFINSLKVAFNFGLDWYFKKEASGTWSLFADYNLASYVLAVKDQYGKSYNLMSELDSPALGIRYWFGSANRHVSH